MNNVNQKGFTLIELIIFMTIVGLVASGLITTVNSILISYNDHNVSVIASSLAKSRMDIILFNRQNNYAGLSDPCASSNSDVCSELSNYATNNNLSVTSTIVEIAPNKTITVDVNNTATANTYTLQSLVSNYE